MQTSESPLASSQGVAETQTGSPPTAEPEEEQPTAEEHIHLPPPTIWPMTTAFGVALAGFGLVTTIFFSAAGLFIMVFGLANWVQELRHERH